METQNDLRQMIQEYVAEKHWPLREYARDTERKLGTGNGISVSTLSFILRNNSRVSVEIANKLAEYHGIPIARVLEMAGYYGDNGAEQGTVLAELIAIRKDVQGILERLDKAILALK